MTIWASLCKRLRPYTLQRCCRHANPVSGARSVRPVMRHRPVRTGWALHGKRASERVRLSNGARFLASDDTGNSVPGVSGLWRHGGPEVPGERRGLLQEGQGSELCAKRRPKGASSILPCFRTGKVRTLAFRARDWSSTLNTKYPLSNARRARCPLSVSSIYPVGK